MFPTKQKTSWNRMHCFVAVRSFVSTGSPAVPVLNIGDPWRRKKGRTKHSCATTTTTTMFDPMIHLSILSMKTQRTFYDA